MQRQLNESINITIMENELSSTDWEFCNLVWELSWWISFFQAAFFRETPLPTPVLTFEKTRINNLGYFRLGLNEFAVRNQININKLYICRPLNEILQTLIHETVHMYEQIYLPKKDRTKSWYHTKAFREKMAEIGILTNKKGCHISVGDPFKFLLEKHQVGFIIPPAKRPAKKKSGRSKLKKWQCPCGQIARVGKKEFYATCILCSEPFVQTA